jgi:hypothetical protein
VFVFVVFTLIVAGCVHIVLSMALTNQTAACIGTSLLDVPPLCEPLKYMAPLSLLLGLGLMNPSTLTECKVRSMRKSRGTSSLNILLGYIRMQFCFLVLRKLEWHEENNFDRRVYLTGEG